MVCSVAPNTLLLFLLLPPPYRPSLALCVSSLTARPLPCRAQVFLPHDLPVYRHLTSRTSEKRGTM